MTLPKLLLSLSKHPFIVHCSLFTVHCSLLFLPLPALPQGSWIPSNADFSYPRSLLKTVEVPAIINIIQSDPQFFDVYKWLYNETFPYSPYPPANDLERRLHAAKAKNFAFIATLNRKPNGSGGLDTLSQAESDTAIYRSIRYMEFMNTTVEGYSGAGGTEYLWRSNELQNHLHAWDLLKGLGVPDSVLSTSRSRLVEYTANLYKEASWVFFGLGFFEIRINNHGLRTAGTLAMAAIILNDESSSDPNRQPTNWMNIGLYNVNNILFVDGARQSSATAMGGYSEGPHYLRFGMKHALPMMHALGQFIPDSVWTVNFNGKSKPIQHPWFDPRYDRIWEWCARIRYPDGRFPPMEDCFVDISYPDLAILEKPQYLWYPDFTFRKHPQTYILSTALKESSDDTRADFLCAQMMPAADTFELFQRLPLSGNLIFRTGWDTNAACLHVNCKNGITRTSAEGHSQADAGSFQIQFARRDLAIDPGYVNWDRRWEVAQARNHNMILVDTSGPVTGTTSSANDANAYLENDMDMTVIDYAEVRTSYQGADFVRKYAMIGNEYFVLADEINSDSAHAYQWRLHGNGIIGGDSSTGNCFLDSIAGHAIWSKLGASLDVRVGAKGGQSYRTETNVHEFVWDSTQLHSALEMERIGEDEQILAVMFPFMTDTPDVVRVNHPDLVAYRVDRNGMQEFFAAGAGSSKSVVTKDSSGLNEDFATRGKFTALGFKGDSVPDFFLTEANDLIEFDGPFWTSTNSVSFAFEKDDSANYSGFCSDTTSVILAFPFSPGSVLGSGVKSWIYNIPSAALAIVFDAGGYFTVHKDVIIGMEGQEEEEEGEEKDRLIFYPNPVTDMLHIQTNARSGEVLIYGLDGKCVWEESIPEKGRDRSRILKFDMTDIPGGLYVLVLLSEERVSVRKIVLE